MQNALKIGEHQGSSIEEGEERTDSCENRVDKNSLDCNRRYAPSFSRHCRPSLACSCSSGVSWTLGGSGPKELGTVNIFVAIEDLLKAFATRPDTHVGMFVCQALTCLTP